jgi:hypothetical protein
VGAEALRTIRCVRPRREGGPPVSEDWGDTEDTTSERRQPRSHRAQGAGLSREQRFVITLAVTAVVMLVVGLLAGMAIGRATAPRTEAPAVSTEPTATAEASESVVPTEPPPVEVEPVVPEAIVATYTPPAIKQLSPADGVRVKTARVDLTWSKVSPPGGTVTYAFDIETYSGGKWTDLQTVRDLKATTYSARVLASSRRWRVWAVVDGVAGPKSGWRTYKPAVATTAKPSTTTTTTH